MIKRIRKSNARIERKRKLFSSYSSTSLLLIVVVVAYWEKHSNQKPINNRCFCFRNVCVNKNRIVETLSKWKDKRKMNFRFFFYFLTYIKIFKEAPPRLCILVDLLRIHFSLLLMPLIVLNTNKYNYFFGSMQQWWAK